MTAKSGTTRSSRLTPASWADDLRAANAAFAKAEQDLRLQLDAARKAHAEGTGQVSGLQSQLQQAQSLLAQRDLELAGVRAAHEQSVELQVSESARWQGQFDTAQREFDLALHQHRVAMAALRADVEHATAMLAAERARQDKDAAALQARFDERTADHLARLHALERELAERSTAHAQTQAALSDALEFGRGRASQAERSALERESLNRALLTLRGEAARDAAAASERLAAAERRLGEFMSALRQRDEQVGSLMTHLAAAVGEFTLTSERLDRARSAALRDRDRLEAEGELRHERAAREHAGLRHRLAHQEALTRDQASEHARQHAEARARHDSLVLHWQGRVAELEATLSSVRVERAALESAAATARLALRHLSTSHADALRLLEEAQQRQRAIWMQAQRDQTQAVTIELQTRLQEAQAKIASFDHRLAGVGAAEDPGQSPAQSAQPAMEQAAAARCTEGLAIPNAPFALVAIQTLDASDASMTPADSLDALLELHDESFVTGAYRLVLGRDPDADGMAAYLGQVRAGRRREVIIAAMAGSPEGRPRAESIPGLVQLSRRVADQRPALPLRALRRALRALSSNPDGTLGSLENRLGLQTQLLRQGSVQTSAALSHLSAELDRTVSSIATVGRQLAAVDARVAQLERRLQEGDERLAKAEQQVHASSQQVTQRIEARVQEAVDRASQALRAQAQLSAQAQAQRAALEAPIERGPSIETPGQLNGGSPASSANGWGPGALNSVVIERAKQMLNGPRVAS